MAEEIFPNAKQVLFLIQHFIKLFLANTYAIPKKMTEEIR
jgi:hypothetical protein